MIILPRVFSRELLTLSKLKVFIRIRVGAVNNFLPFCPCFESLVSLLQGPR